MNPYILVDFCERDARTRQVPSVGLAQARPNNDYNFFSDISEIQD